MSRLRWLFWGLGLLLVVVLLVWARGPLRALAWRVIGRVKLREREAAKRLENTKRKDAEAAVRMAKTHGESAAAKAKADKARVRAHEIEHERRELANDLEQEIEDEERARRFRERHGLSNPRDPPG